MVVITVATNASINVVIVDGCYSLAVRFNASYYYHLNQMLHHYHVPLNAHWLLSSGSNVADRIHHH